MPTSKSKARKRKHKQRQSSTERLKRKLAQWPLRDMEIVIEPQGQVKMSDVLERFVEPYLEFVDTAEAHSTLFTLGALAWNAAFLPPDSSTDGEYASAAFLPAPHHATPACLRCARVSRNAVVP